MFRKTSSLIFGIWIFISLTGCSLFENPVGPSDGKSSNPVPSTPRTFTVVSGETFQPVGGARVTLGLIEGVSLETDFEGKVFVEDILAGDRLNYLTIEASGFLKRQFPLFVTTKDEVTLWPDRPGFDSQFTKELLYFGGSEEFIRRPRDSILWVALSDEVRQDKNIVETHKKAAQMLMSAFNGHIRPPEIPMTVELVGFDDVPYAIGAIMEVSIDPASTWTFRYAFPPSTSSSTEIIRAWVRYHSMAEARSIVTVLQYFAMASGLRQTSYPGIMGRIQVTADFTSAEKLAMRLSLLRRPGNQFPDSYR